MLIITLIINFMSSRLPIDVHVNDNINGHGVYDPNDRVSGIPRNMTGIAEKLNEVGYIAMTHGG